MYLQTLIIVFVVSLAFGQDRKIISDLNPGCRNCTSNTTLVHIRAIGAYDTVHQLWDFTRGIPTMVFAIAGLNSSLEVMWRGTEPSKFFMSEEPKYSFAIAIDKLYEYDDIDDNGHIDEHCPHRVYPLNRITWQLKDSKLTDGEAMVRVHSGRYRNSDKWKLGTIDIKLDLLPFKDYATDLPHLIHTANSTLVDVSLVNLTSSRDYNASRFALHTVLASTDSRSDTMHYAMRKSLDDEHTPGVFEIIEIKTPLTYTRGVGGFVQFRPVAYTQPERSVTSSTIVHVSNFNRTLLPEGSTLDMFYGNYDKTNMLVQDMFVSFGETGDGYYVKHNYTSWSFTIGYGSPPVEGFSLFVILVISIGLGVPVALALSGVVYVLLRRHRQRNSPRRFTDDD